VEFPDEITLFMYAISRGNARKQFCQIASGLRVAACVVECVYQMGGCFFVKQLRSWNLTISKHVPGGVWVLVLIGGNAKSNETSCRFPKAEISQLERQDLEITGLNQF